MSSERVLDRIPHSSSSTNKAIIQVANEQRIDNLGRAGFYSGSLDERTRRPHGNGRMEYYDSSNQDTDDEIIIIYSYEGQWFLGDWSGFGTMEDRRTGNSYEGTFLDNRKHGLGIMIYANEGSMYDGTYQFDQPKGKGRMRYADGSTYWGSYFASDSRLPHGRGKLTYPNGGPIYDGEFERGCRHGHGRMTLPDGSWYLGEWGDGKKNGIGLDVMANGHVRHEGTFCNDLPVLCSSFPQRRLSTGAHLLYRSSSSNNGSRNAALVGPMPRHLRMERMFVRRRLYS